MTSKEKAGVIQASPEEHRIEIPEDVMAEIQRNKDHFDDNIIWTHIIWMLLVIFRRSKVEYYINESEDELLEDSVPIDEDYTVLEYEWKEYRKLFDMNRVWARQLSRSIQWFSQVPF